MDRWRLNGIGGGWCAETKSLDGSEYIEMVFPESTEISGVVTQGRESVGQWVTKYKVGYIEDGCSPTLKYIEEGGQPKVFNGNSDSDSEVAHTFPAHLNAVSVRIYPTEFNSHPSLRFDLKTCSKAPTKTCTKAGIEDKSIPASKLTSSTVWPNNKCNNKENWRLNSNTGWCASTASGTGDWIGVDFDESTEVSGLITQGRADALQYVTRFKVGYTESSGGTVKFIKDENSQDKVFTANYDQTSEVEQVFPCHLNAFSIRIYPTAVKKHASLRFEVMKCTTD